MKKVLILWLSIFCSTFVFAQSFGYTKLLNEGKKFETEKKYVHALKSYFDAVDLAGDSDGSEANQLYKKLLKEIKKGNPGKEKLNVFGIHSGWQDLTADFESCWKETCPYDLEVASLEISDVNYQNRTVFYQFDTVSSIGKYNEIFEAVKSGYKIAYRNWTDMPKDWADNLNFDYKVTLVFVGTNYGSLLKCTVPVKTGTWTLKNISEITMDKIEEDEIHAECLKLVSPTGLECGRENILITSKKTKSNKNIASDNSGKVLNIYSWNEEFKERLVNYFPEYDISSDRIGDVKVNWMLEQSFDGNYQNKLDEYLSGNLSADEKIDIFLVEPDYALKYLDSSYLMNIEDLGITEDDLAGQFQYTKEVGTNSDGDLKALTWQICSGGFVYNRSIANEVFGTEDPKEIQSILSDWKKFNDAAKKVKQSGYYMLPGYQDSFRVFYDNMASPWVVDGKINIDQSLKDWISQSKTFTEQNYNAKISMWSSEWFEGIRNENVFGYFGPSWFIDYIMSPYSESEFGGWGFCKGPQGFFWGGSWICVNQDTDNVDLVTNILKTLTCNDETMFAMAKSSGDCPNNKNAITKMSKGDYQNDFLQGQNHWNYFYDSANSISKKYVTVYDSVLNELFIESMAFYFNDEYDLDEAYEYFYKSAHEKFPNLSKGRF